MTDTSTDPDLSWLYKETFLGDGLFASFDGYQFRLRAPRANGDHFVCLDSSVLAAFEVFVAEVREKLKEHVERTS